MSAAPDHRTPLRLIALSVVALLFAAAAVRAGEADLAIPDLYQGGAKHFDLPGVLGNAWWLLFCGAMVICGTLGISLYLRAQIHKLPAHRSMLNVAEVIYQTCKTYLIQQGKFLLMLWVLIACAISYYLVGFGHTEVYQLTDRMVQEMRLANVPEDVVTRVATLKTEE